MLPMSVHTARLLLVSQRRDTVAVRDPNAAKVRRYRLARMQLNAGRAGAPARHEHLKRLHD
jgi:hypothetical protein